MRYSERVNDMGLAHRHCNHAMQQALLGDMGSTTRWCRAHASFQDDFSGREQACYDGEVGKGTILLPVRPATSFLEIHFYIPLACRLVDSLAAVCVHVCLDPKCEHDVASVPVTG